MKTPLCLLNIRSTASPSPGLSGLAEAPIRPTVVSSTPTHLPLKQRAVSAAQKCWERPGGRMRGQADQVRAGQVPAREVTGRGAAGQEEGAKRGRAWGLPEPLPTLCPGRAHLPT